jgi:hypothetical protein
MQNNYQPPRIPSTDLYNRRQYLNDTCAETSAQGGTRRPPSSSETASTNLRRRLAYQRQLQDPTTTSKLDLTLQSPSQDVSNRPRRLPHWSHLSTAMSSNVGLQLHDAEYGQVKKQSSSPEPQDGSQPGGKHRRNYQACDRCRQRKV